MGQAEVLKRFARKSRQVELKLIQHLTTDRSVRGEVSEDVEVDVKVLARTNRGIVWLSM